MPIVKLLCDPKAGLDEWLQINCKTRTKRQANKNSLPLSRSPTHTHTHTHAHTHTDKERLRCLAVVLRACETQHVRIKVLLGPNFTVDQMKD